MKKEYIRKCNERCNEKVLTETLKALVKMWKEYDRRYWNLRYDWISRESVIENVNGKIVVEEYE
jgi:hypothetical protein